MGMPLPPVGKEETKFLIVIPFLSRPFPLLIAVLRALFPLRENYTSVQRTSLWIPFPYLRDLTRVNSLRLPRKSYRIGGLLFDSRRRVISTRGLRGFEG